MRVKTHAHQRVTCYSSNSTVWLNDHMARWHVLCAACAGTYRQVKYFYFYRTVPVPSTNFYFSLLRTIYYPLLRSTGACLLCHCAVRKTQNTECK